MLNWNESDKPPADLLELWQRMNRLVRSLKDIVIIEDKTIVAGVAGTMVSHGQFPRTPRAAIAYLANGTTSTNPPVVSTIDQERVKVVVGGADVKVNILLVM